MRGVRSWLFWALGGGVRGEDWAGFRAGPRERLISSGVVFYPHTRGRGWGRICRWVSSFF